MFFFPVFTLALAIQAPPDSPQSGASRTLAPRTRTQAEHSLVAAELAFAERARQEGTHAAFLGALDDEGVLFRPGPVNGKAWLRGENPDNSRLTWHPSYVEASQAGDVGYSTGPYQWRASVESKEASHGHFVSIWGRRGVSWKLLLDTGAPHPAPAEPSPVFVPVAPKKASKTRTWPPFSAESLKEIEKEFSSAASARGLVPAYGAYLAEGARFYRPGSPPTSRPGDIRKALEMAGDATGWTCLGAFVARSHDLGYAYGISQRGPGVPADSPTVPGTARKKFTFLHIWKRQSSGRWKVVLDIESPIP